MTKIAIEVTEQENIQLKLISMENNIPSKAMLIEKIVSDYLKKVDTKGIMNKEHMTLVSKEEVR